MKAYHSKTESAILNYADRLAELADEAHAGNTGVNPMVVYSIAQNLAKLARDGATGQVELRRRW